MIAAVHYDGYSALVKMEKSHKTWFFAVSKESSKFLRPRLIRIVVLDFTHYVLVYILVLFFLHFARWPDEDVRKLGRAGCSYFLLRS